jgi:hypothetical protein
MMILHTIFVPYLIEHTSNTLRRNTEHTHKGKKDIALTNFITFALPVLWMQGSHFRSTV